MKTIMSVYVVGLIALSLCVTAAGQDIPKTIKGGILNGKATSLPQPEYPAEARAAGLEGTVRVDVTIDEEGNVISAKASDAPKKSFKYGTAEPVETPAPDPLLREAAEAAALQAKFSPTRLSGVPVKVSGTIAYRFVLKAHQIDETEGRRINGGILNGKANFLPAPAYPDAARAVRASGTVTVRIEINENGAVESATPVSGHPLLRPAALEAAKAATFAPTYLSGQPVRVAGVLTYNFVLDEKDIN